MYPVGPFMLRVEWVEMDEWRGVSRTGKYYNYKYNYYYYCYCIVMLHYAKRETRRGPFENIDFIGREIATAHTFASSPRVHLPSVSRARRHRHRRLTSTRHSGSYRIDISPRLPLSTTPLPPPPRPLYYVPSSSSCCTSNRVHPPLKPTRSSLTRVLLININPTTWPHRLVSHWLVVGCEG